MNEPTSNLNERDLEDMKLGHESEVKKYFKKLNVTTYTNKMHLPFLWLNHRNSKVKCA